MLTTYFTLGQTHKHDIPRPEGDLVWDKDGVVAVEAETEDVAIDFMFLMFGDKWASHYNKETMLSGVELMLYPKGIVHTYTITPGNEFASARNSN